MGIWCQNDVVSTSMRRHHVASTLIRRHFMSCARWGMVVGVKSGMGLGPVFFSFYFLQSPL